MGGQCYRLHTLKMDGKKYSVGYKVVTEDLKSTGLSGTPVRQYSDEVWNVDLEHGIWVARVPSFATYIRSYMHQKYRVKTRTFVVALQGIKEINSNGVRASEIKFLKELNDTKEYNMEKVI